MGGWVGHYGCFLGGKGSLIEVFVCAEVVGGWVGFCWVGGGVWDGWLWVGGWMGCG